MVHQIIIVSHGKQGARKMLMAAGEENKNMSILAVKILLCDCEAESKINISNILNSTRKMVIVLDSLFIKE